MKNFLLKYYKCILLPILILVGWYGYSVYAASHQTGTSSEVRQIRENSENYKFINPLILVIDNRNIEYKKYTPLKNEVDDYISSLPSGLNVEEVSFYFRDLNGGEWIGLNEDSLYAPASMMKVSVLMAYLKLADINPAILQELVHYKPTGGEGQFYKPKKQLPEGLYTIKEILEQMIVYSDNDAVNILDSLHTHEILKVYADLELPDPLQDNIDFMSPRTYSRLFRTLYNGSYISKVNSEWALRLLSQTDFKVGIRAGVPESLIVSSKFGELTNFEDGKLKDKELHECGIVYDGDKRYLLCVMTRGMDLPILQNVITKISKITYDFVEKTN